MKKKLKNAFQNRQKKKAKSEITDREKKAVNIIGNFVHRVSIWHLSSIMAPNEPRTVYLRGGTPLPKKAHYGWNEDHGGSRYDMYCACPSVARVIKSLCKKKLILKTHWSLILTDKGKTHVDVVEQVPEV